MLIHSTMAMALAETRRDDLIREVRTLTTRRRTVQVRPGLPTPQSVGLNRRLGHALRRLHRTRAAEPAA